FVPQPLLIAVLNPADDGEVHARVGAAGAELERRAVGFEIGHLADLLQIDVVTDQRRSAVLADGDDRRRGTKDDLRSARGTIRLEAHASLGSARSTRGFDRAGERRCPGPAWRRARRRPSPTPRPAPRCRSPPPPLFRPAGLVQVSFLSSSTFLASNSSLVRIPLVISSWSFSIAEVTSDAVSAAGLAPCVAEAMPA